MRLFTYDEAEYFFNTFNNKTGSCQHSIEDFQTTNLGSRNRIVREGTTLFDEYRDCITREIERSLFFATSFFRRSLDLLKISSSSLAYLAMYYGSWYASHAFLAMFGSNKFNSRYYIDVYDGTSHSQAFSYQKIASSSTSFRPAYKGSHQVFWEFFYSCTRQLIHIVDPKFSFVLFPISGNTIWQIENRNQVNYDLYRGLLLCQNFEVSFSENNFPASLSGVLGTQYQILISIIELAFYYYTQFNIGSDSLNIIGVREPLKDKINDLIVNSENNNVIGSVNFRFLD